MENKVLVAVYGSLRKGFGNHGVMSRANGEYKFTGKTKENYALYSLGYYPAVSKTHDSDRPVVVEVYEVPKEGVLGPLDTLEGYPNYYNRTITTVIDKSGQEHECWLYHIDSPWDPKYSQGLVTSGDWADV